MSTLALLLNLNYFGARVSEIVFVNIIFISVNRQPSQKQQDINPSRMPDHTRTSRDKKIPEETLSFPESLLLRCEMFQRNIHDILVQRPAGILMNR